MNVMLETSNVKQFRKYFTYFATFSYLQYNEP